MNKESTDIIDLLILGSTGGFFLVVKDIHCLVNISYKRILGKLPNIIISKSYYFPMVTTTTGDNNNRT